MSLVTCQSIISCTVQHCIQDQNLWQKKEANNAAVLDFKVISLSLESQKWQMKLNTITSSVLGKKSLVFYGKYETYNPEKSSCVSHKINGSYLPPWCKNRNSFKGDNWLFRGTNIGKLQYSLPKNLKKMVFQWLVFATSMCSIYTSADWANLHEPEGDSHPRQIEYLK